MVATKQKMDFTNVEEGGNFRPRHKPEGDYPGKVVDVVDGTSKADNAQWIFTIKIDGDERSTYPVYCGLDPKQAWKIRQLFIAAGMNVPKKMVMVDPNKLVGKSLGVALEDDEYEGKIRSKAVAFMPLDDMQGAADEGDEDDDELYDKPAPKKAAKKKAAPVEDDDDEDDEDDEDEPPAKKKAAAKKPATKRRPEPEPEDDEDDDEDEEDEPPARKKASAKKAAPAAKTTKKRRAVEEDDEDDIDLDEI